MSRIHDTDRLLEELGPQITDEDLAPRRVRPSAVRNRTPRTGMFWLVNSYGHAREHLAQLQLTKQLFDETHQNDPPNGLDAGEPDELKGSRPVRWGGRRKSVDRVSVTRRRPTNNKLYETEALASTPTTSCCAFGPPACPMKLEGCSRASRRHACSRSSSSDQRMVAASAARGGHTTAFTACCH